MAMDMDMTRLSRMGGEKSECYEAAGLVSTKIFVSGPTRYRRRESVTPSAQTTPVRTIWRISC